jgi:hypothetical protein
MRNITLLEERQGHVRAGQRHRQLVLAGRLKEEHCHIRAVEEGVHHDIDLAVVFRHGSHHLQDDAPVKAGTSLDVLDLVRDIVRRDEYGVKQIDLCSSKDTSKHVFVLR